MLASAERADEIPSGAGLHVYATRLARFTVCTFKIAETEAAVRRSTLRPRARAATTQASSIFSSCSSSFSIITILVRRSASELHYFIEFLVYTFLRPTESEVFALRHRDVRLRQKPKSLQLYVDKPKTKNAPHWSDSAEFGPGIYDDLKALYPDHKSSDYVFLPGYENRTTAKRIFQNQFNYVLDRAGLKDSNGKRKHSVYSLRHTAITKRLLDRGER